MAFPIARHPKPSHELSFNCPASWVYQCHPHFADEETAAPEATLQECRPVSLTQDCALTLLSSYFFLLVFCPVSPACVNVQVNQVVPWVPGLEVP